MKASSELLEQLAAELDGGRLRLDVQARIHLDQAPQALAANRTGGAPGKTVQARITIGGGYATPPGRGRGSGARRWPTAVAATGTMATSGRFRGGPGPVTSWV
ncbi:hypothetical protein [Embleya sp. NPDC020630]|uniref:hypothetical protein n=1 Tax=Embleya sp. NPDC020630 TaxID=3363979 RepID=UPI0037AC8772